MVLKSQASQLTVHSSDVAIGSVTGGSASSSGMPGVISTGSLAGSGGSNVGNTAGGVPQYDISFVFPDSSKLAKNAKRSYESQVCDPCIDFPFFALFFFAFFLQCLIDTVDQPSSLSKPTAAIK